MEGDPYALMRQIANGPGTHFGPRRRRPERTQDSLHRQQDPRCTHPPSTSYQMRLLLLPVSDLKIPPERQRKGLGGEDEKKSTMSYSN